MNRLAKTILKIAVVPACIIAVGLIEGPAHSAETAPHKYTIEMAKSYYARTLKTYSRKSVSLLNIGGLALYQKLSDDQNLILGTGSNLGDMMYCVSDNGYSFADTMYPMVLIGARIAAEKRHDTEFVELFDEKFYELQGYEKTDVELECENASTRLFDQYTAVVIEKN